MSLVCLSSPDKRVAGSKQVLRFLKQGLLEKVFIAKDADEGIAEKLKSECEKSGVPYDTEHTMHQIGSACQIEVGSACAGVVRDSKY